MADTPETEFAVPSHFLNWERPCSCGRTHRVPTRELVLRSGLLAELPGLLSGLGTERRLHVVTHRRAWNALPLDLVTHLRSGGFEVTVTCFDQLHLVPDETAVERLGRECPEGTPLALAVGSGVIHDLTRDLATRRGFEFDSVPTAPSMDGYASGVAPLLRGGFKETQPGKPPRAIWGDLEVLAAAPGPMIAAGVGDLAGKALCLRDWELGALLTGEYHCTFISDLMEGAWGRVKPLLGAIRQRQPEAIRVLMESLILSGMGMVMAGNSRPASGAEHHLSHFWEMKAQAEGRPPQLHGLKVAAAAYLVSREVQRLRPNLDGPWSASPVQTNRAALGARLSGVYGPLTDPVLRESLSDDALAVAPKAIEASLPQVRLILSRIPKPREVGQWLGLSGISRRPQDLGVSRREVREALKYAPYLRNRYTVLRLRDQALVPSGILAGLAIALVAANLALATLVVSAGVVASTAWNGAPDDLRGMASKWTFEPLTGAWQVESRRAEATLRSTWDGSRWVMSEVSETPRENTRKSP